MFRLTIGAAAIAALFLVPRAVEPASAAQNDWTKEVDRQPIFVCDTSGATWLGQVQSTILVWSDGDVCFSWKDVDGDFRVGNMKLPPKSVHALVSELVAAEAWTLTDQWPHVMDIPLHTVTVLDPGTDARAHTFSYWIGANEYSGVDSVMDRLEQEAHRVR